MKVTDLRTENRQNPLGVDVRRPVFSWRVETGEKNWYQKCFQILVKRGEETVWDSGAVKSGAMNQVEYAGAPLLSDCRYHWQVEVTSVSGQTALGSGATFETGLFSPEDWGARWIRSEAEDDFPVFCKHFSLTGPIREARLFICGLGHQKTYINREDVTDAVLEAGWTDYRKTCLYCVYDVTALLRQGENGISVKLGDGMYNVPGGRYVYYKRSYGKKKLLLRLRITYESGETVCVISDTSWRTGPSPIKFCCIYGGEDYDGRISEREPSAGDFSPDDAWGRAVAAPAPEGMLRSASAPPLRVMERYAPKSVRLLEGGGFLVDLGTNFSGWARIRLRTGGGMAGKRVTLTPAEILTPEGQPDQRVTGKGYAWTYICGSGDFQEFAPDFTYTGFRYVKVEGAVPSPRLCGKSWPAPQPEGLPVLDDIAGEFIYPDMEETGSFSCSNGLFNKIHAIVRQAMLSNIKSYFTDCPHREKLPWLEETHLIGPAMMCSWDLQNLYEKIERDMADSQRESGLVPDVCPEYVTGFERWHEGFVDSPEWGSACVINLWHLNRRYGSLRALREWYPTAKKYVDYLTGRTWHGVLHHGLGDWLDIGPCTPYSQNTPVAVTATCVYYMDLGILQNAAQLLGKNEDAEDLRARRETVFEEYNRQFLDAATGRYATGSQTAQAMSLVAGLVPEAYREKVLGQLRDEVTKRGYAITAGDVGHPYLVAALMMSGMSDILNRMTNITETPGYGYQVMNGATTLTEEWDGPDPAHPHGSQNHLMLGSIDEWFYCGLGGLGSIRTAEAFDRVTICPHIAEGVDWCEASFGHPYGKISVSWKREPGDAGRRLARVTVTVPPNLTAILKSEDGSFSQTVGSGVWEYRAVSGEGKVKK